nr:MAG TPA: hypothetical protein [Caudoviricetes sp.]
MLALASCCIIRKTRFSLNLVYSATFAASAAFSVPAASAALFS